MLGLKTNKKIRKRFVLDNDSDEELLQLLNYTNINKKKKIVYYRD